MESRHRASILLCLLIPPGLLTTAACGDEAEVEVLTGDQSRAEIELSSAEKFEVHLESNPSTGFAWEISPMASPDLVTLDSKAYVEPDSDLVGVPGTEVFVFTTGSEGAGILRLEYIRSSDDPPVAERVVEFILRIDGADWPPTRSTAPTRATAVSPTRGEARISRN